MSCIRDALANRGRYLCVKGAGLKASNQEKGLEAVAKGKRAVSVVFTTNGKKYAYFTDDDNIMVGDYVVVQIVSNGYNTDSASDGFKVVKVVDVAPALSAERAATKWIIDRVDVAGFKARQERAEQRALIEAQIEKEMEEFLRRDRYRALAEQNPLVAELVAKLNELEV